MVKSRKEAVVRRGFPYERPSQVDAHAAQKLAPVNGHGSPDGPQRGDLAWERHLFHGENGPFQVESAQGCRVRQDEPLLEVRFPLRVLIVELVQKDK